MFIYKITNKENNKVYIGQTIRPIEQRFKRHINDAINGKLNTHFARAIRKYGEDKFVYECIDTAKNQKELSNKEQYWIRFYNSVNEGYNETDTLNKCGGNTYQSKNIDELKVISEKIKESKIGNKNPNHRKIKCYNIKTNEELIFETVKDCQKYFNEEYHRFISTRVLNKTKSLYNTVWKIAYFENDYFEFTENIIRHGLRVLVKCDKFEKEFISVRSLCKELKISRNKFKEMSTKSNSFEIDNYKIQVFK